MNLAVGRMENLGGAVLYVCEFEYLGVRFTCREDSRPEVRYLSVQVSVSITESVQLCREDANKGAAGTGRAAEQLEQLSCNVNLPRTQWLFMKFQLWHTVPQLHLGSCL